MKKTLAPFLFLLLLLPSLSFSHEPIFGLGAHTLYQGGYSVEVEYEREEAGSEKESSLDYLFGYGVTPDFTIALEIPQFIEKEAGGAESSGLGDLSLRGKYRFIRIDEPGASLGVALNFALKLPSGDETKAPPLGTGSADYTAALSVNRESLRRYYFGDIRYRINTEANGVRKGNVFFVDAAYGIRPWRIEYLNPDLVVLVELNYEKEEETRTGRVKDSDTGGTVLFASPGFLLSYRNVMFKGGVQIPVFSDPNGTGEDVDWRGLFSVELHL